MPNTISSLTVDLLPEGNYLCKKLKMKFLIELSEDADIESVLQRLKALPEINSVEAVLAKKQAGVKSAIKASKTSSTQKGEAKKSNIIFGTLKGQIKVAPDCWDEDMK